MIITSIDCGELTGVATAKVTHSTREVTLERITSLTAKWNAQVVSEIVRMKPEFVLLEGTPLNASRQGKQTYEPMLHILKGLSTAVDHRDTFEIISIAPSTWKPFMRSRIARLRNYWTPLTGHESDAAGMLVYWVFRTYVNLCSKKEISYVS